MIGTSQSLAAFGKGAVGYSEHFQVVVGSDGVAKVRLARASLPLTLTILLNGHPSFAVFLTLFVIFKTDTAAESCPHWVSLRSH